MTKEDFEIGVKDHLEIIRGLWNDFLKGTAWEEQNHPLCLSVFKDSISAFSIDYNKEYIVDTYVKHHDS